MAKIKKVNLLANMPDEPGELSGGFYDGDVPPHGMYKGKLKRLSIKTNRNGDPMLNGVIEIAEKSGPKAEFNGYGIWFNQNVTEQGAPFVDQFLRSIGCKYKDLGTIVLDESTDPPMVTKIGAKNMNGDTSVTVVTKRGIWNGTEKLEVTRFVIPANDAADEDEDVEDEAEDEAEEAAEDEAEDDDASDDGSAYSREELAGMTIGALRELLREQEWGPADWKGMSKADLVAELAPDEDSEPPF